MTDRKAALLLAEIVVALRHRLYGGVRRYRIRSRTLPCCGMPHHPGCKIRAWNGGNPAVKISP